MDDEYFAEIVSERAAHEKDEIGLVISAPFAARLFKYNFEYSAAYKYTTRKQIYDVYRLPFNYPLVTLPTLNLEVSEMFCTDYHRRIDNSY